MWSVLLIWICSVVWFSCVDGLSYKYFIVGSGLLVTYCMVFLNWIMKLKALLKFIFVYVIGVTSGWWWAICAFWWGIVVRKKKDLWFNHKIMIKVQESPLNIMVTRNLWFVKVWVGTGCARGDASPPMHLT